MCMCVCVVNWSATSNILTHWSIGMVDSGIWFVPLNENVEASSLYQRLYKVYNSTMHINWYLKGIN